MISLTFSGSPSLLDGDNIGAKMNLETLSMRLSSSVNVAVSPIGYIGYRSAQDAITLRERGIVLDRAAKDLGRYVTEMVRTELKRMGHMLP